MDKKIRSISISYGIDEKLILDSKSRGLTISKTYQEYYLITLKTNQKKQIEF